MKLHPCAFALLLALSAATALHAEAGPADAQARFQLARMLLLGEGVPKDEKKAFELMKAAADQGHADAIGGLGYFYSTGTAVGKDEKKAAEWFRKGAERGSAKAQLNLGKMLLIKNSAASSAGATLPENMTAEGLEWVRKSADSGLPEAALTYGGILYFGDHGVEKDFKKSAALLKIAAADGSADACNILGNMSELGLGVPVDSTLAIQWFRKAALQGNVKGQGNLGRLLGPESANQEVRIESLAWLLIASGQGDVAATKLIEGLTPGAKEGEMDAAGKMATELKTLVKKK